MLTSCAQWANYKKTMILVICSIYSFLGNASLTGPAVYIGIFSEEFNITPTTASGLISWPNLAYGFGSWVLVPTYLKFGRRPVMLGSMLIVSSRSHLRRIHITDSFGSSLPGSPEHLEQPLITV
jgi:MFS family permease